MLFRFYDFDKDLEIPVFTIDIEEYDKYVNALKIIKNVTLNGDEYKACEIYFRPAETGESINTIDVIVERISLE